MRFDFHFHAALSKKIGFDHLFFQNSVTWARSIGLGGIALTDHFNSRNLAEMFETLERTYPLKGDAYLIHGVTFFLGLEIDIVEGLHILVVGKRDDIYQLHDWLMPFRKKPHFAPAEQLFGMVAEKEMITICAHPLRPKRQISQLPERFYKRFDAFGLNAKDLHLYGEEMGTQMSALASAYDLPLVAGSDTHHPYQLGAVYNELPGPVHRVADLKEIVTLRTHTCHVAPDLDSRVGAAIEVKRRIKRDVG